MKISAIATLVAGLISAPAFAATTTLDFDSLAGYGTPVAGTYAAIGLSFGPDALVFDNQVLENLPSGNNAFGAVGTAATMNYTFGTGGLADAISFSYASVANTSVSVYDGVNGSGNLLATFTLTANNDGLGTGCTTSTICVWTTVSQSFSGLAKSVTFGDSYDTANALTVAAFDNLSVTPVPVPAAGWLLASALGGLGAMVRRRRIAA